METVAQKLAKYHPNAFALLDEESRNTALALGDPWIVRQDWEHVMTMGAERPDDISPESEADQRANDAYDRLMVYQRTEAQAFCARYADYPDLVLQRIVQDEQRTLEELVGTVLAEYADDPDAAYLDTRMVPVRLVSQIAFPWRSIIEIMDALHNTAYAERGFSMTATLAADELTQPIREKRDQIAAQRKEALPATIAVDPDRTNFPLAKTQMLFDSYAPERYRSPFDFRLEGWGESPITAQCITDFSELESLESVTISRTLTSFDNRVMLACDALKVAGNDIITYTMIYHTMGFAGRPAEKQIARIRESVLKLSMAVIDINLNPYDEGTGDYMQYHEHGNMLLIHMREAFINGKRALDAIEIFERPILVTFAKHLRQITTIPNILLSTPQNKTERIISIEDYLLKEISRAKRNKKSELVIRKRDLYDKCGITTKDAQRRTQRPVQTACAHYAKHGFIYGLREKDERGKTYRGKWVIDLKSPAKIGNEK